jgi:hypothetical protein
VTDLSLGKFCLFAVAVASISGAGIAQTPEAGSGQAGAAGMDTPEILKAVDRLVEQNRQLEKQNQQLIEQITLLRQKLAAEPVRAADATPEKAPQQPEPAKQTPPPRSAQKVHTLTTVEKSPEQSNDEDTDLGDSRVATTEGKQEWGTYTPNLGFKVANTEYGDLSVSIYTYVRYLNQLGLNPTYTDGFGNTKSVMRRQDVQLNKVQIKFLGWILSPKLRYFLYAWTNNATMGLPAQVVLAGNLNYTFNKYITVSGGITSLPGTRSVEGNFPFWFSPDSRLIADEFFRPSYTSGFWARGEINDRLRYNVMIGNNLSTLGVSAAQLDNKFDTQSYMVQWLPTTGEFGLFGTFGDYDFHEKLATRIGLHFTHSLEEKQSQPGTDAIENTQIRLTDGSTIFAPNLFGPGITVNTVDYKMMSLDGGVKYKGLSLEGEYYRRWLTDFTGTNTAGIADITDNGYQLQSSGMVVPKILQLYLSGSQIFGIYGDSSEVRFGGNWYFMKERGLRVNGEFIHVNKSPVGYTAYPLPVGANGNVFHLNLEMNF